MTFYPLCRNFAQMEGGKLMARGLYKNLVTHLVMMEGEGLIETEDIAVAVVEAQEAAVKKGFKLYQHIADKALVGRGKATLSLMDVSDHLLTTPVKMQKEGEGRKEKVRGKQEERAKPSEVGKKKEAEVREGKEEEEVVLLQMETNAVPELSGRGDEKEKKRKRRRRRKLCSYRWRVMLRQICRGEEMRRRIRGKGGAGSPRRSGWSGSTTKWRRTRRRRRRKRSGW